MINPKIKNLFLISFVLKIIESKNKITTQNSGSIKNDNILEDKKNTSLIMINFAEKISKLIIILQFN